MGDQELLYKIWEKVNEVDKKVEVSNEKQKQYFENHLALAKEQTELKRDHYKLKDTVNLYKGRYLFISSLFGSGFGIAMSAIYNYLKIK